MNETTILSVTNLSPSGRSFMFSYTWMEVLMILKMRGYKEGVNAICTALPEVTMKKKKSFLLLYVVKERLYVNAAQLDLVIKQILQEETL